MPDPQTTIYKDEIEERFHNIIAEKLGIEPRKIMDGRKFDDDLGADSLDLVELIIGAEEEFGITFTKQEEDHAPRDMTVGEALKIIRRKCNG